jgi:hypothetical protein
VNLGKKFEVELQEIKPKQVKIIKSQTKKSNKLILIPTQKAVMMIVVIARSRHFIAPKFLQILAKTAVNY